MPGFNFFVTALRRRLLHLHDGAAGVDDRVARLRRPDRQVRASQRLLRVQPDHRRAENVVAGQLRLHRCPEQSN